MGAALTRAANPSRWRFAALIAVWAASVSGQETQPAGGTGTSKELEQARTILTDVNASPQVRRIGADSLLGLGTDEAFGVAIEVLLGQGDPGPKTALCEAIAGLADDATDILSEGLVDPLLQLLGSSDAALRSAAALALCRFPNPDVVSRLGALAADGDAPSVQRAGAIDALAANVDRRAVVQQLVVLLDSEDAGVAERVLAALKPASREDFGDDVERWKAWWQAKSALDDRAWLEDRVSLLREENRRIRAEADRVASRSRGRQEVLAGRLVEQLEVVYRLTPPPGQDELLAKWLGDTVVEFREAAVGLIAVGLSDGNRPSTAVRQALRSRVSDPSAAIRRHVFDVLAALTDPADAEAALQRLDQESDNTVREAIVRTLGRLGNPVAIPSLVAELSAGRGCEPCVIEAAVSLGLLGSREDADPEAVARAVGPLKARFASAGDSVRLKAALLGAMAGLGAADCSEEFLSNLEATEPDLLLPALEGVRSIGDASRVDRILALTASNDARVRRRAIEALVVLGGDEAHLETLVNRLSPSVEPNDGVRQAAWEGFGAIVSRQSIASRLTWAERLKDLPEREELFLAELIGDLSQIQPVPAELALARRRLAEVFDSQSRFAESFGVWRDLWQSMSAEGTADSREVGLAYLAAMLQAGRYEGLAELVPALTSAARAGAGGEVEKLLADHLEQVNGANDDQRLQAYLIGLERLDVGLFGAALRQAMDRARTRIASPSTSGLQAPVEG